MNKYLTLLFSFLFLPNTFAQFDLQYGTSARSYPSLSGDLNANAGYSFPLWGTPSKTSTMYGLVRPNINLDTSVVVSSYDANLTIFPISFIGLGLGKKEMKSNYDEFTYYDCETIRCKGSLNKVYTMAKIALAYGPLLGTYYYKHFNNEYDDQKSQSLPVAEYEFALEVNPSEETQVQKTAFLGFKIAESTIGIVSNKVEFLKSDKSYFLNIGIFQTQLSMFKAIIGAGTLGSTDIKPNGVIVFKLTHHLWPSLALF